MKKILVLGGTGAMGRYLVPELLKLGYKIDVISLDDIKSDNDNLSYKIGNAKDIDQLSQLLKGNYDGIVDFMTYNLNEFKERIKLFLDNTGHYLFLSSCRVFANEDPIVKETSPRLLDISTDEEYLKLKETEYSLFKALEENMLTELADLMPNSWSKMPKDESKDDHKVIKKNETLSKSRQWFDLTVVSDEQRMGEVFIGFRSTSGLGRSLIGRTRCLRPKFLQIIERRLYNLIMWRKEKTSKLLSRLYCFTHKLSDSIGFYEFE